MRRFFVSFLGAMAALWVTIIVGTLGLVGLIFALGSREASSQAEKMEIKDHSILHLDLNNEIVERADDKPSLEALLWSRGEVTVPLDLQKVITAIESAADDDKIEGIYIEAGIGTAGFAQCTAVIKALDKFKKSGKWIYAYGDSYTQTNYIIASASDSIFINPIGGIDVHGLGAQIMYYKGLLDKIGVKMDVVRVGNYKSAVEPFTRTDMSEAAREQTELYLRSIWESLATTIAKNRKVNVAKVNEWADSLSTFQPESFYLSSKMADRSLYRHQMEELLVSRSGLDEDDDPRLVPVTKYAGSKGMKQMFEKAEKHIAVLYADGEITQSGKSGITSDNLIPEIQDLTENENVAGLILRVNSPGGDAFASEQIWEALQQFKKITGKPFYVSMSDVAASGGYYISCGADRIYAEPVTITGSIGIFGMLPDVSDLLNNKLGLTTSEVYTNPKGNLPTVLTPMTDRQRDALQGYVNRGYELFTLRCAQGRNIPQDSIKAIGGGRVWDGRTAQRIGLVDKLGGLDSAVADMAKALDMKETNTVAYPVKKYEWFYELLSASSTIKEEAMKYYLGAAYSFYQEVQKLQNTSVLQARMEASMPQ